MQNFLLSIPKIKGKHSSTNITEIVLTILNKFNVLNYLRYIVTDNASSNSVALKIIAEELNFNNKYKQL